MKSSTAADEIEQLQLGPGFERLDARLVSIELRDVCEGDLP
jgi:hypothetical protein